MARRNIVRPSEQSILRRRNRRVNGAAATVIEPLEQRLLFDGTWIYLGNNFLPNGDCVLFIPDQPHRCVTCQKGSQTAQGNPNSGDDGNAAWDGGTDDGSGVGVEPDGIGGLDAYHWPFASPPPSGALPRGGQSGGDGAPGMHFDVPPTEAIEPGPMGGIPASDVTSNNPVGYGDGAPTVQNTDLASYGFGKQFGQTRSWTRSLVIGPLGPGWESTSWPNMVDAGAQSLATPLGTATDVYTIVGSGTDALWFDVNGSTYTERSGGHDTLTHTTETVDGIANTGVFILTDSTGGQTHFFDFSTTGGAKNGMFIKYMDAYGNSTTVVSRSAAGNPTEVQRTNGSVYESWVYTYNTNQTVWGQTGNELLSSVTLRRSTNSGANWTTVRSVQYAYYGTTDLGGDQNFLKSATIQDAGGNAIDTWAYRYYRASESGGREGTLKMVFDPQAYSRLTAAGFNVASSNDGSLQTYATNYFQYDSTDRVTSETSQGSGCSCSGSNGQGTETYTYLANNTQDYNAWNTRTTEVLNDDNQMAVYTNYKDEPMLELTQELLSPNTVTGIAFDSVTGWWKITAPNSYAANDVVVVRGCSDQAGNNGSFVVKSATSTYFEVNNLSGAMSSVSGMTAQKLSRQWGTFYRYDGSGRVITAADPAAVAVPLSFTAIDGGSSTDQFYSDLLNFNNSTGLYTYLNATTGLIATTDYYSSSTLGWSFAGTSGITGYESPITGNTGAPNGNQAAFLLQNGSMSQSMTFNCAGTYTLTYYAAGRENITGENESIQVKLDGVNVGSAVTPTAGTYAQYTVSLSLACGGSHTVSFGGSYSVASSGAMIDSVAVTGPTTVTVSNSSFETPTLTSSPLTGSSTSVFDPIGPTATSSTAGGVGGYFYHSYVQQGQLGLPVFQETRAYLSHTSGGNTVYPLGKETVYRNTDGTGAENTSYSYTTWTSNQPTGITITYPTVTTAENGPNSTTTASVTLDQYGRVTAVTDPDGFVTNSSYDIATGSLLQTVVDSGVGHLALTTNYVLDGLGRVLKETDPAGRSTVYVYKDSNHETRTYSGWTSVTGTATATSVNTTTLKDTGRTEATGSFVGYTITITSSGVDSGQSSVVTAYDLSTQTFTFSPAFTNAVPSGATYEVFQTTNPISVSREFRPSGSGQVVYEESMTENLNSGSYVHIDTDTSSNHVYTYLLPDGGESIGSIDSLSRDLTNKSGQTIESDAYANLTGVTYSTTQMHLGTAYLARTDLMDQGNWQTTDSFGSWYKVFGGQGYAVAGDTASWPSYLTAPTMPSTTTFAGTDVRSPWLGSHASRSNTYWTSGVGSGANFTIDINPGSDTATHQLSLYMVDWNGAGRSQRVDLLDSTGATVLDTASVSSFSQGQYVTFSLSGHVKVKITNTGSASLDAVLSGIYFDHDGNYYPTAFEYDERGNVERTQAPTGTITRTEYDVLNRPTSMWLGTSDVTGNGNEWSPTNKGSANMVDVLDNEYDGGSAGDGDLTKVTVHPDGTTGNDRVTQNLVDWRNRQVATKEGVQGSEDTTTHRPIFYYYLDNLGEVTEQDQFDGDTVTVSSTAGVPQPPSSSLLRARTTYSYDEWQRPYLSQTYEVNQSTGAYTSGVSLNTNFFYNKRSLVIAEANPGGLFDKYAYDAAGRVTKASISDGGVLSVGMSSALTWTDASVTTNDVVLSQVMTNYDDGVNVTLVKDKERFDNDAATATGDLGDKSTSPAARVSYSASYYDAANRLVSTVDLGTNGGNGFTYSATSTPARGDAALRTDYAYDVAGRQFLITDPRGIQTYSSFDMLDRVTQTIAAYTGGSPAAASDQTTNYAYDGDGNVVLMTAVMPSGTNSQETQYVYGVGGGSNNVFSNDLLFQVRFPDATSGLPSTASASDQTFTYNAAGDKTTFTDQNGTLHTYNYDVLGRLTADVVTTVGSGVDGTIRRLGYSFDTGGRPYQQTSYTNTGGTTVANQVQDAYNGFGQLTFEYQAHTSAVNTTTSPKVQYAYTETSSGTENDSRISSMTYPNGRVLDYAYNTGLDSTISRLSAIKDDAGTYAGVALESYTYLGLGTIVQRTRGNGINLSYIQQSLDNHSPPSASPGGDTRYTLDAFGRVTDQAWFASGSINSPVDRFQYAYDRDGNVLYRNNIVSTSFGELYHNNAAASGDNNNAYDNLNRLTAMRRGTLSANPNNYNGGVLDTVATLNSTTGVTGNLKAWTLDAIGNWGTSTNSASPSAAVATDGTTQNRSHNSKNQITAVSGLTTPTYDNNGNMTRDENNHTFKYDAWNRMVAALGTTEIFAYDADNRRPSLTLCPGPTVTDSFYSHDWQLLQEGCGTSTVASQYVWGQGYVDDLIARDDNTVNGGIGFTGSGLGQRLYAEQDANYNVTSITDNAGTTVKVRVIYDPYGTPQFLTSGFTSGGTLPSGWEPLFQGLRYDSTSGKYDGRNRIYDPTLGVWMQEDPAGYRGGSNLYQTELDDPIRLLDPDGLYPRGFQGPRPDNAPGPDGRTMKQYNQGMDSKGRRRPAGSELANIQRALCLIENADPGAWKRLFPMLGAGRILVTDLGYPSSAVMGQTRRWDNGNAIEIDKTLAAMADCKNRQALGNLAETLVHELDHLQDYSSTANKLLMWFASLIPAGNDSDGSLRSFEELDPHNHGARVRNQVLAQMRQPGGCPCCK